MRENDFSKEALRPNPANFETYEKTYQRYVQLYDNLVDVFAKD